MQSSVVLTPLSGAVHAPGRPAAAAPAALRDLKRFSVGAERDLRANAVWQLTISAITIHGGAATGSAIPNATVFG